MLKLCLFEIVSKNNVQEFRLKIYSDLYCITSVFKALKIYGTNEIKRSLLFINFENAVTYDYYYYNKKLVSNTVNNKVSDLCVTFMLKQELLLKIIPQFVFLYGVSCDKVNIELGRAVCRVICKYGS